MVDDRVALRWPPAMAAPTLGSAPRLSLVKLKALLSSSLELNAMQSTFWLQNSFVQLVVFSVRRAVLNIEYLAASSKAILCLCIAKNGTSP